MNFERIFELITKEQKKIEIIIKEENTELDFYEEIVLNNNFSNLQGLLSLDYLKIMTAYLYTDSRQINYTTIYELLKKNQDLINPKEDALRIALFNYFTDKTNNKKTILMKTKTKAIEYMLKKLSYDKFDFETTAQLFNTYGDKFTRAITVFTWLNQLKKDYDNSSDKLEEEKKDFIEGRASEKKKSEFLKEVIDLNYDLNIFYKELLTITNHYEKISNEDKLIKKKARKSLANYANLINKLKQLNPKNLLDKNFINSIINYIDNEEILKEFLIQINIEYKKYFDELNIEFSKLSQDNQIIITSLLKEYELDINKIPPNLKKKLFKFEKEKLELFLKLIKELGITEFDIICFVLEHSDCEILKNYIDWIKDGVLTLDFLIKNKEFLSMNKDMKNNYNSLLEKIMLFKKVGINYRIFINDLDIYLVDSQKILYNISELKQYNLIIGINKLNSFELLKEDNLESKIDLFLELGYEKILEENIQLLNVNMIKIKKLYILKNLGLLPVDMKNLMNILENKNFLDYIDDIDSYIFNIVNYRIDPNLLKDKELDINKYFLFDDNSRVIDINGIFLSKNRIKRNILKLESINLSEQDKMIYSFVYGSILSEEEYNTVISNLSNIDKKVH